VLYPQEVLKLLAAFMIHHSEPREVFFAKLREKDVMPSLRGKLMTRSDIKKMPSSQPSSVKQSGHWREEVLCAIK